MTSIAAALTLPALLITPNVGAAEQSCSAQDPRVLCLQQRFGFSNPAFSSGTDSKVVYWDHRVDQIGGGDGPGRGPYEAALAECGLEVLKPGNFTDQQVRSVVESITHNHRAVHAEGRCSSSTFQAYRNAGVKVNSDTNCNQGQGNVGYDVNRDNDGSDRFGIADKGRVWAGAVCRPMATPECRDGIDNDGDGATDYPADFSCTNPDDNDETNPKAQCQDGQDNDGDGKTDFPVDPGCTSRQDNDEFNQAPTPQCRDGIDNDGDGATDYPADFSCSNPDDNDETLPKAKCQDGIDNDSDGLVDYPQDPGCTSKQDNDEFNVVPQCRDGVDNDGDGKIDYPQDPGCTNSEDNDEFNPAPTPQCRDGIDNDGDGAVDYPNDFSCSNPDDNDETFPKAQCQDGQDNDGDGKTDFPVDPGCTSRQDNDEFNQAPTPQCRDGIDNDGDGAVDYPNDFSCSNPDDNDETFPKAQCQDGQDNDGDGKVDYPQDPGCTSKQDNDEFNAPLVGCIEIHKETFSASGNPITPVAQFTFRLDGTTTTQNNGAGNARFDNVTPGSHTITEVVPSGWNQILVTPANGVVNVQAGSSCAAVVFKNQQAVTNIPECRDGQDNDGDGDIDYPQDRGCTNPDDNNEGDGSTDISITKTGPTTIQPGSTISYTVTVGNLGVDNATSPITFRDQIPSGLTFVSASDSNCTLQGTVVRCSNIRVNHFQTRTFTFTFQVPASATCGSTIVNNAVIESTPQGDPQPNNNQSSASTTVQCAQIPQCRDGIDNDGDGAVDYPNDFSCSNPDDNDETFPKAQCQDGVDNDGDGFVDYPQDPGCSSKQDNDEFNAATVGCVEIQKQTFTPNGSPLTPVAQFTFRLDGNLTTQNNSAGIARFDNVTPGSHTITEIIPGGWNQTLVSPANGVVNVTSGNNCASVLFRNQQTITAVPQCRDGIDNDGDGFIDYPSDPGCSSSEDNDEFNTAQMGCVEVRKETVDQNGNPLYPIAQFTFTLDGSRTAFNNSAGYARFDNVSVGSHTITEVVPSNWELQSVSPSGGFINVTSGNNCALVTFRNRQSGQNNNLTIEKTDNTSVANEGDTLTYKITVRNNSSVSASNISITDTLPPYVTFEWASDNGSYGGQTINWHNQFIGANSTRTYSLRVRVNNNVPDGYVLRNIARTNTGISDEDVTRIESDDDDNDADGIRIDIVDSPDPVEADEILTYDIRIRNTRNVTRSNLTVLQILPDEIDDVISISDGGSKHNDRITWRNVNVGPNAVRTFRVRVRVPDDADDGDELETSVVTDGDSDEETTEVVGDEDDNDDDGLQVEKEASQSEVFPGGTVEYTITITNDTGKDLEDIEVIDNFLSSGIDFLSDGNADRRNGNRLTWEIDRLRDGQTRIIRYRVAVQSYVLPGTILRNEVEVTSDDSNASDSAVVSVLGTLPQTGFGGYGGNVTGSTSVLRPWNAGSDDMNGSFPIALILALMGMGTGVGVGMGRKVLFGF